VEKARAAAEAQLQAAKALPAAYLREVFPAPDAPPPQGWRWVKLGEVCEREVQNKDPHETRNIPFRYIDISSVDNVRKSIVSPQTLLGAEAPSRARQVVRTNDVLVSTTRPNLNAVAIVPPELDQMICSTGFCVLRPTIAIDPTFLFLFVQSKEFVESLSSLVVGALYPAVKDSQVKDQLIPLPPLPEQRRIAGILKEQMAAVEKARAAAEAQLSEINALPSALLRQAFSGQL
jgi:type I restriction enzyme S subunit